MKEIVKPLLEWYGKNARVLPWRQEPSPYHVWISEIMLQQTRVEAVREYYRRFLERFDSVEQLAGAKSDELMKLWQGLGYYNRARNLQRAAQIIVSEYGGRFPDTYEELLKLPGVGEYTAGAIASIAFGKRVPAVDGNVCRIYTRLQADGSDITAASVKKRIRSQIQEILPEQDVGAFNQAWMDLGSAVCVPNGSPHCDVCPLQPYCLASRQGNMEVYPVRPQKKERKKEDRTVLLLEYQGRYMIQKRPEKGLLAGLWEFPSQEGRLGSEELSAYLAEWNAGGEEVELLGKGKHIFSHIEWHMLGYLVHLNRIPEALAGERWVSVEELRDHYSIPSAFQCYYKRILEED